MTEPTRPELSKARRALKKLGELDPSEARVREIIAYLQAQGIVLLAHGSSYLANFLRKNGNGFSPPSRSNKPSLFARPTDPAESHDAATQAEMDMASNRKECFERFSQMIAHGGYCPIRNVFEFDFLPAIGYKPVRAKSICRRMSDLTVRPNNPFPETLWLFCKTGKRFNGSALHTHTERGRLVLAKPELMTGLWGQRRKKKSK